MSVVGLWGKKGGKGGGRGAVGGGAAVAFVRGFGWTSAGVRVRYDWPICMG